MATCGRRPSARPEHRLAPLAVAAALAACDPDDPPGKDVAVLPDAEACDPVREWAGDDVERESALLDALAQARALATSCGALGTFPVGAPLVQHGALTCAARRQARHMADVDTVGHTDENGDTVVQRIAAADYDAALSSEVVAAGDIAASRIVAELWQPSDPHCAALHGADWTDVGAGVAYSEDSTSRVFWVVVLATPQG